MMTAVRLFAIYLTITVFQLCYGRDVAIVVNDTGIAGNKKLADIFAHSIKERGFAITRLQSDGVPAGSSIFKKLNDALTSANVKKGDRVVLYFECHGSTVGSPADTILGLEKPTAEEFAKHTICAAPPPHSDDDFLSALQIKALAKKLLAKSVKVGIIDGTCGGGATVVTMADTPGVCTMSKTTADRPDTFGDKGVNKVLFGLEAAPRKRIVNSLKGLSQYWQAIKMHNALGIGALSALETPLRSGCASSLAPFDMPYNDSLKGFNLAISVPLSNGAFDVIDGIEGKSASAVESETRGHAMKERMWLDDNIKQVASCDRKSITSEFQNLKKWETEMRRVLDKNFEDSFHAGFPALSAIYQDAGVQLSEKPLKNAADLISEMTKAGAILQQAEEQEVRLARQINSLVDQIETRQNKDLHGDERKQADKLREAYIKIQQDTNANIIRFAALGAILREIQCAMDTKGKPDACDDFILAPNGT